MTPRILAFAGSTRRDSFNKKLVSIAVKGGGTLSVAFGRNRAFEFANARRPLFNTHLERDSAAVRIFQRILKPFQ